MTTEKIYSSIIEMVKAYAEERGDNPDFVWDVLKDPTIYAGHPGSFYGRAVEILLDCREKMDKKTAGAGRLSVCKRMVKECTRPELSGIHAHGGKFCILNGYMAFRFRDDMVSIGRCVEYFEFDKAFSDVAQSTEVLPTPSRADIKAYIAETGSTRKAIKEPYTPDGWPDWYAVNPFYLLDVLDAIPGAEFYKPGKYCTPIYFTNGDGDDGILCPVAGEKVKKAWLAHVNRTSEQRSA